MSLRALRFLDSMAGAGLKLLILKRLGFGILTLAMVSLVIFASVELLPGDLAEEILGQSATPESLAAIRSELGLDRPPAERYWGWLSGMLAGDFGRSLANGREITDLLAQRLGNTLFLATYAAALAVPLAIGLGAVTAMRRNTVFDRLTNLLTLSAISLPEFFIAYLLIMVLTVKTGLFPLISNVEPGAGLIEYLYSAFLPALTLTMVVLAHMMRMTRASIISVLAEPYIEMAHLKGLSPWRVIFRHALPNALAPILSVIAVNLAYLVTSVFVVEMVFVYPGLGQMMVDSVAKRDLPVVQAACLIFACVYILLNLTADILSIATNPRLMHKK